MDLVCVWRVEEIEEDVHVDFAGKELPRGRVQEERALDEGEAEVDEGVGLRVYNCG